MGQLEVQDSNMLVSATSQALSSMNIIIPVTGERVGGGEGRGGGMRPLHVYPKSS